MPLNVLRGLPAAIAAMPAPRLAEALPGPTLFDLRREGQAPLFVSVLLHGNEISGWDAVRQLGEELAARSALVLVGNVAAAQAGVRTLPGQPDFNRIWAASAEGVPGAEAALAAEVMRVVAASKPQFAVDIHNNTGRNPPYAVVADTAPATLALAASLAERVLLATQPRGFFTARLASLCPSVTVEVGTPDDAGSTPRAVAYLRRLIAAPPSPAGSLDVFETKLRVTVSADTAIATEVQCWNFRTAPAGTVLARAGRLRAWDAAGQDLSDEYLARSDGATRLRRPAMLAMFTGSLAAARQDCLCYFLEPKHVDG